MTSSEVQYGAESMMVSAVVMVLASVARVAAPTWETTGLDKAVGTALETRFGSLLRSEQVAVVSDRDIEQTLGLQRQRSLLGCDDQAQCLAELSGALGAEFLLSALLVQTKAGLTANLKLIATSDGHTVISATQRCQTERELADWLDAQAPRFHAALVDTLPKAAPGAAIDASARVTKTSWVPWVPGAVGLAAALTGTVFWGISRGSVSRLNTADFADATAVHSERVAGQRNEALGLGLLVGGGVAMLGSVVWASLSKPVAVTLVPTPTGAAFVVSGALP